MRHHIYRGAAVLISLIFLMIMLLISSKETIEAEGTGISFRIEHEVIHAYAENSDYYLFLPSYAKLDQVKLTKDSDTFVFCDSEQKLEHGDTLEGQPLNQRRTCINEKTGMKFTLTIMQSENIASMFVNTASGSIQKLLSDKDYEEKASLKVVTADSAVDCITNMESISGRGNYSWDNYEKKPFVFSIGTPTSILGLSAGEKWVLVSNASDPTLIRNELVKGMEKALDIKMKNAGTFVDLYVNGEYLGNYYLCEKIEVGESRVGITDLEEQMKVLYKNQTLANYPDYETEKIKGKMLTCDPEDITGGYIIEREFKDRYEIEYADTPSSFITDAEEHFIVDSPKYCSKNQITYISSFVQEAEDAILSDDGFHPVTGKKYTEYIDVESFVKKYLVEEVSKNYDGGISSAYFYKDSDSVSTVLHAGPGWDFDMTFGNYLPWMEYFSKDPTGISRLSLHDHASNWYTALLEKKEYEELVEYDYAKYVAPYLEELLSQGIDSWENKLRASAAMDETRWKAIYEKNTYYTNREDSYLALKDFIEKRKQFLDSAWVENEDFQIVKFVLNDTIYEIRYIQKGSTIGSMPVAVLNGKACSRWTYEGSKVYAAGNDTVEGDLTLYGEIQ